MKKTRSNIILCSESIYKKWVVGTDVCDGIELSNVPQYVNSSNIPDVSMSMNAHSVFDTIEPEPELELELELRPNINIVKKEDICEICCLCGCNTKEHHIKRHKFIPLHENYRCQVCSLFFYQHNHSKNPCFRPKKYIY